MLGMHRHSLEKEPLGYCVDAKCPDEPDIADSIDLFSQSTFLDILAVSSADSAVLTFPFL